MPRPENSRPLYQEVVFTDPQTADEIKRVKYEKSPIAKMFPKAPIHPDVEVRSGYRIWDVARATLADMYLTSPMWLEDPAGVHPKELFFTGAMNISPIESALSLGDEVMAIRMKELRAHIRPRKLNLTSMKTRSALPTTREDSRSKSCSETRCSGSTWKESKRWRRKTAFLPCAAEKGQRCIRITSPAIPQSLRGGATPNGNGE